MLHPSTKKLIDRLSEMTLQRKIDWVQGEAPGTLAYDTEGYRVLLEGEPASLVLCDALGGELDRASIEELSATKHIDGGTYETFMEAMRAEASRIARGAEDAITSVLGSLDLDGDGIPDVPAPVELEAAPDGPMSETMDDIEDNADELSAAAEIEIDASSGMDDFPAESLETADDMQEVALDTVFPDDDFADILDLPETPLSDITADDAETLSGDISEPVSIASFEDPDVGQAVADLAEQVNNTQAEAQLEDTGPSAAKDAPAIIGTSTFLTAFNGFPGGNSGRMIVQETVDTPAEQEQAAPLATENETETLNTDAGLDTLQAEQGLQAETLSNFEQIAPGAPKPGETLSLSGLADSTSGLEEASIGTASLGPIRTAQHPVGVVHPNMEDEQEPEVESEAEVEAETEAEAALETPSAFDEGGEVPFPTADDEIAPEPAMEAEPRAEAPTAEPDIGHIEDAPTPPPAPTESASEDEISPETEEPSKAPKRFNPWI